MLRYVLALLLINTHCRSLGNPVQKYNAASLLTALAKNCANQFLFNQINNKIDECNITIPPYDEKQFQCLIFYDINRQLCDAANASKLVLTSQLTDQYISKINKEQDVDILCATAQQWHIMNITNAEQYKLAIQQIFKSPSICAKICGEDNLMSVNTNFFCKYYKWGKEMLEIEVHTTPIQGAVAAPASPSSAINTDNKNVVDNVNSHETVINITQINEQTKVSDPATVNVTTAVVEPVKTEESKQEINGPESSSKVELPIPHVSVATNESVDVDVTKIHLKLEQDPNSLKKFASNNAESNTGPLTEEEPPKKVDLEAVLNNQPSEPKEPVIENPKFKAPVDPVDYQESDEGKEGLPDSQGDDEGDDPMLSDLYVKSDQEQDKNSAKRIESPVSSFNGEMSQKEFFPNAIQDGFTDDDDHFFPFFLTAVVLVVLIYVLYHNKNKVSKVFLGLIVEGRQSGRRRNSRGHAYRRLDTLEQAMSATTAAPPSKIIY